ncbi:MAG TPA: hypothetical protein PLZ95_19470 [Bryobacteraceae bacterium]|nr:hypothetical protein [Bryobacteraceae bacterium]
MATEAQIAANRANAQLSTGPKTAEGKASSSKNNLKYGLTSKEFVVLPGQEEMIAEWLTGLRDEIQPCGALEVDVFRQLAHASWTLHRCRHAEVQSFANSRYPGYDILAYPVNADTLKLIDTYTRRAERSYHRALNELKTLQTERLLREQSQPAPAPLADPRIVNKQQESATEEAAITAEVNQTRGTESVAVASTISEKSNPIPPGQGSGALEIAAKSQPAGSPVDFAAGASGRTGAACRQS